MPKLSKTDRNLVAGGGDTELLDPVFGVAPTPVSGDSSDPSGGIGGDANGGGGEGSGGGGGGASGEGPVTPPPLHVHLSPAGNTFSTTAVLSEAQTAVAGQILDFGRANSIRQEYIRIAVEQAFYETSLATNFSNKTHFGMFQYSNETWASRHGDLDINNPGDQIRAIYRDIDGYGPRYTEKHSSGEIPWHISFDYYVELMHHGGTNFTDWGSPWIEEYRAASLALGFQAY